jgi:hypothetical protein
MELCVAPVILTHIVSHCRWTTASAMGPPPPVMALPPAPKLKLAPVVKAKTPKAVASKAPYDNTPSTKPWWYNEEGTKEAKPAWWTTA